MKQFNDKLNDIFIKSGKRLNCMEHYAQIYRQSVNDFGPNVAVFYQLGAHYNIMGYDGEYKTNVWEVSKIMDCAVSLHGGPTPNITNPWTSGFPVGSLSKFSNRLLEKNFHVVVVDQVNPKDPTERKVTHVHSPAVSDVCFDNSIHNNLVCIVIENQNPREYLNKRVDQYELSVGLCSTDISTNITTVYEISSTRKFKPELASNEIYRFLQTFGCKELVVYLEGFKLNDPTKDESILEKYFRSSLELDRYNISKFAINEIPNDFKKLEYQNLLLSKIFGNELCGPGVTPLRYLEIEMYQNAAIAYCCLIDYIFKRNETYLQKLQKPMWWNSDTHLVLAHNAIRQLDIISDSNGYRNNHTACRYSSLIEVLDKTATNQGQRLLEQRLLHPMLNIDDINRSYNQIEEMIALDKNIPKSIESIKHCLQQLVDFDKIHRKCDILKITPADIYDLIGSYNQYIQIVDNINRIINELSTLMPNLSFANLTHALPTQTQLDKMKDLYKHLTQTFDHTTFRSVQSFKSLEKNMFRKGVDNELDDLCSHLGNVTDNIETLRKRLTKIVDSVGNKSDKCIKLVETKSIGVKFQGSKNVVSPLKYYKETIKNAMYSIQGELSEKDRIKALDKKIRMFKNGDELIAKLGRNLGGKITDSGLLDWAKDKKIAKKFDINSDEEEDSSPDSVSDKYLSIDDIELILSLDFYPKTTTIDICTKFVDEHQNTSDEYFQKFVEMMQLKSQNVLRNLLEQNKDIVKLFSELSAQLDVIQSNSRCAIDYRYYKPTVISRFNEQKELLPSFLDIKGLRHPIIERIQEDIEYVKNDLKLGRESFDDDSITGILLFAVNNGGKTTLEKAIALIIDMAQAGCYVPADSLRYRPFKGIITRLEGTDNMWKGQGSYAVEMSELRTVANQSTINSLVLGDEICRGTEQNSSIPIMCATVEWLCKVPQVNFIFSTHYHEMLEFDKIKKLKQLGIYHLRATIDRSNPSATDIVYDHKLSDGIGDTLFGIEVARCMGYNEEICNMALEYRHERLKRKTHFLDTRKSKYHKGVYMDGCMVPGCTDELFGANNDKALDTHHEKQQHTADENGKIDHHDKNAKHNLIPLCKKHHHLADKGELHFTFKSTGKGVVLFINGVPFDEFKEKCLE